VENLGEAIAVESGVATMIKVVVVTTATSAVVIALHRTVVVAGIEAGLAHLRMVEVAAVVHLVEAMMIVMTIVAVETLFVMAVAPFADVELALLEIPTLGVDFGTTAPLAAGLALVATRVVRGTVGTEVD
jgi:hypothetical protein